MNRLVDKNLFASLTAEECLEQIGLRHKEIEKMVGWLYPSILRDEITQLHEIRIQIIQEGTPFMQRTVREAREVEEDLKRCEAMNRKENP